MLIVVELLEGLILRKSVSATRPSGRQAITSPSRRIVRSDPRLKWNSESTGTNGISCNIYLH